MSAYVGSEDLADALKPAPCGCAMADQARDFRGAEARTLAAEAPRAVARWGCPAKGEAYPANADHLDGVCREVLRCAERLTGARGFTTCPLRYAAEPWVGAAVQARNWREKNALRDLHPMPSAVLIDAIDVLDRALDRRASVELERHRAEAEEARRNADNPKAP